jgi:hypothetical protein
MRSPDISVRLWKLVVVDEDLTSPIQQYQHNWVLLRSKIFEGFKLELVVIGRWLIREILVKVEVRVLFETDPLVLR